jgi:hypothetical protein
MEQMPNAPTSPQEKPAKNNEAFIKNLHDILSQAYKNAEDMMKLYASVSNFASGLEQKYPDARSRRLFHLLISSTPGPEDNNMEDYPGEDSIVRFIEGLQSAKV